MKHITVIIALFFSFASFAQKFDGVYIGGDISSCVAAFKAKGYRLVQTYESGVEMQTTKKGENWEVHISKTPKTNKVWKVTIYLPKRTSWYSLLSDYEEYVEIMNKIYGKPYSQHSFFISPYELGDGYELQAVRLEKCRYLSAWTAENATIGVLMSKFEQISLQYENNANNELRKIEMEQMDAKTFKP